VSDLPVMEALKLYREEAGEGAWFSPRVSGRSLLMMLILKDHGPALISCLTALPWHIDATALSTARWAALLVREWKTGSTWRLCSSDYDRTLPRPAPDRRRFPTYRKNSACRESLRSTCGRRNLPPLTTVMARARWRINQLLPMTIGEWTNPAMNAREITAR